MTIEEFIAKELIDNPDPSNIIFMGFEASPSRVWSERTSESFSCNARFDRLDERAITHGRDYWNLYLDEEDVCRMLNTLFPAKPSP